MSQNKTLWVIILLLSLSGEAWTQETSSQTSTGVANSSATSDAENLDISAIKEKYWARGNETEMGVIQNRLYSKSGKFQLGVTGGVVYSDPFLSIQNVGGNVGYHLTEYIAFEVLALKYLSGPSAALEIFKKFRGATANTNMPIRYYGAEFVGSLLYGKLSLVGKSIIYYDFHLLAGGGMTETESGKSATAAPGLGQRFYISRFLSMRMDYRLMFYNEIIVEKEIPTKLGQPLGERMNWSHTINLGVDFMFGGGK